MNKERSNTNENKALSLEKGLGWPGIYFIGIGGIGMSALARYFHTNNVNVSGYDRVHSVTTDTLEELGVKINY